MRGEGGVDATAAQQAVSGSMLEWRGTSDGNVLAFVPDGRERRAAVAVVPVRSALAELGGNVALELGRQGRRCILAPATAVGSALLGRQSCGRMRNQAGTKRLIVHSPSFM